MRRLARVLAAAAVAACLAIAEAPAQQSSPYPYLSPFDQQTPYQRPGAGSQEGMPRTPLITNVPGSVPGRDGYPQGRGARPGGALPGEAGYDRVPLPPPEPNEFQKFVASSLGRFLPLYGQELFAEVPSTFAPLENVPVTPDYLVGPGDELYVRAWGQIDIDYKAIVDRNGTISIPRVGVINVAGVRYQDLGGYVKAAVSRVFRNFELSVTLGQLRAIQVFVVGHARKPGSYTVGSLSTLVNTVFAAGGPSPAGSMRNIQLKRAGRTIAELDLYDLLLSGDKSKDAALLPGDVIYFSPIGPLAAVSGSVNTPAVYELRGETTLQKLLEWSGGLSTTAQVKTATIERIDERRTRTVDKFSLDGASLARALRDGDVVTILPLAPRFENAVTLRGNVAVPLRHPFTPGMRVRDLIPDKEALVTYDYYRRQNRALRTDFLEERVRGGREAAASTLERDVDRAERERRLALRERGEPAERDRFGRGERLERGDRTDRADRLERAERVERDRGERPDGAERGERERERLERLDRMARQDQFDRTERRSADRFFAEINWDYAVIERLSDADFSTALIPFNLGKAVLENDPAHNLPLKAGDIVTVFSKDDIAVPVARQRKIVRLEGEFNFAGVYQAQPGETLRSLVVRAGGLTGNAYVFGSEFTRESVRAQQDKSFQETLNRIEREQQAQAAERARSTVSPEDAEALKVSAASQQTTIARLRDLRPSGRVALELPEEARLTDLPDITLEDGDRLFVPARPAMISVFGSVFTEGSFLFREGRSPREYLSMAGGTTKRADTSQIFVLRADGSAAGQASSFFGSSDGPKVRVMPGDTIVVPEDYERQTWTRTLKDWAQIFYQFGLGAAAIKVLRQ